MNKFLLPVIAVAMVMLPAAANAEQCRASATGKFAKCGTPGAVPASQYVAKTKTTKAKKAAMAAPMAATPAKSKMSSMMGMMKPKPAAAKAARCKTAKGKFVKCGTPGAMPAA